MIAFGPVPSRRLGFSLGVNNIPYKHCSYSCVYCQVGRTNHLEIIQQPFYSVKEILREVETSPLEQAINCFQRDLHPEKELLIWENISSSYELNAKNNPEWTIAEKEKAFGKLLLASLG